MRNNRSSNGILNSSYLCRFVTILGIIRAMSRMSRTEMVMRTAVKRLLRSRIFLFFVTMIRKRRLRNMARKDMRDQPAHHQFGLGIT